MKNIFFYIYPERKFAPEYILMSETQIDNSLLYWKPEDIILVTNFPWEYRGIKAITVGDKLHSRVMSHGTSLSNKPTVIKYLIENNLVDDVNWFHDWDIYQLAPLELSFLDRDVGFVNYSYKDRIQLGSIFFKPRSLDIFTWIKDAIDKYEVNEEEAVNLLIEENFNNIQARFQKLDITYNVGMKNAAEIKSKFEGQLKIAHFPPYKPKYLHKARKVIPTQLSQILDSKLAKYQANMKNLLVYISPHKKFNPEHSKMIEVQIDNSLDYWKAEDIILLTNFPYVYKGVRAIVGPDDLINKSYTTNPRGIINSKINAIVYLLENKIINGLTWFHDFDSFQLAPLDPPPIEKDLGLVCYGIYPKSRLTNLGKDYEFRINCGNIFFKPESLDIFKLLLEKMDKSGLYEEDAITVMLGENENNIASRVQIMNQTYNIGMRCVRSNIEIADKPLRVAHFPPHNPRVLNKFKNILPVKLSHSLSDRF